MKKNLIFLFVVLQSMLIATNASSQNTVNVSGGTATLNGNTYEYSIGEMVLTHTVHHASLIVTQGFLQPDNHTTRTLGNQTTPALNTSGTQINVYPNPTSNTLLIDLLEEKAGTYQLAIYDASGRVIQNSRGDLQIGPNQLMVNLTGVASGNYYLLLSKPNALGHLEEYSYRIQKIN